MDYGAAARRQLARHEHRSKRTNGKGRKEEKKLSPNAKTKSFAWKEMKDLGIYQD